MDKIIDEIFISKDELALKRQRSKEIGESFLLRLLNNLKPQKQTWENKIFKDRKK